jgi:hypothetical protein
MNRTRVKEFACGEVFDDIAVISAHGTEGKWSIAIGLSFGEGRDFTRVPVLRSV